MKKLMKTVCFPILALVMSGCYMPWEKDTDEQHLRSYEPITGKFVLHDALDKRNSYSDTYFVFNGEKGNFSMKYYENGELKREGKFNKILTYKERIGTWSDSLHLNIKIDSTTFDHISTYTESFEPLNQFRIIEEYKGFDTRYYLSELPYVMGTYVREGEEYVEEKYHNNDPDPMIPMESMFTSALDGTFKLDNDHYFYFLSPKAWSMPGSASYFYDSYFQYYAPTLEKPLEGFATGSKSDTYGLVINLKLNRESVNEWKYTDQGLYMGYPYYDEQGLLDFKYGTVDFVDGVLNGFTFEKVSKNWTEKEMNDYVSGKGELPDPVQYDYVGGTYTKVVE